MRWLLFLLLALFLSCKPRVPQNEKQALIPTEFSVCDDYSLTTGAGQTIRVQLIERDTLRYTVIDNDTLFELPGWRMEFGGYDSTVVFRLPLQAYADTDLSEIASLPDTALSGYQWLLLLNNDSFGGSLNTFSLAKCYPLQLDNDKENERIIETTLPWRHRYYVLDRKDSGWKNMGVIELIDRMDYASINSNLPGHFGLRSLGWGTGHSEFNIEFFRLTADSIEYCLSVNEQLHHIFWTALLKDYYSVIESKGTFSLQDENTIRADYHITFGVVEEPGEESPEYFLLDEHFICLYKKGTDQIFYPAQPASWFDPEHHSYFVAEEYLQCRLDQLKIHGTRKQKRLLDAYTHDPELYGHR